MASASEDKDVSSIAPVGNKSKVKPEKAKPKTSRQVSNKLRQDVYPENKGKEVMQQYAEELKAKYGLGDAFFSDVKNRENKSVEREPISTRGAV
ncbi:hypothetical protein TKK_0000950 [Trichogramma kaykai]